MQFLNVNFDIKYSCQRGIHQQGQLKSVRHVGDAAAKSQFSEAHQAELFWDFATASLQKDASGKLFALQRPPLLGGILGGSVKKEKFVWLIVTEIRDPL